MNIYNVCAYDGCHSQDGKVRYYVQGYPTGRTSCTVMTRSTLDRSEAEAWAEAMNRGERVPEAQAGMYADD